MTKNTLLKIRSEADKILTRYGTKYTPAIRDEVTNVLINALGQRVSLVIYSDEEELIKRKLTVEKNPYSRQTRLRLDFYNKLITDLDSQGIVKGRPFDIPLKITRQLILTPADNLEDNIRFVQILHDDLLEFRELPDDLRQAEIDCVCTFIASAAIFAKITFPDLHRWIFSLKFHDIHLGPDYINRQVPNSNAFSRYFLPFPSNLYFMRSVLFYIKNHKHLKSIKPQWNDDNIFQPTVLGTRTITSAFKKWIAGRLEANGVIDDKSITLPDFYKAVQAASIIDLSPGHEGANRVPPFIISVQSGDISCYSYSNKHFPEFLGERGILPEHRYKRRYRTVNLDPKYLTKLKGAFHSIRGVRRSLLSKIDTYPLRRAAASDILDIAKNAGETLHTNDARNIVLYAKWLSQRLLRKSEYARNQYLDFKSINDQAPMVETLLMHLAGTESIDKLSQEEQQDIIKYRVYPKYGTHNVQSVLSDFTTFLETIALKGAYKGPNWSSKELRKEDVPSLKSFITPSQLQAALQHFEEKFTRYVDKRYKNPKVKERERKRAIHKAGVLGMMTELAYYTGLRIHEITLLQVKDFIYDGGFVICIRKKTKTKHGDRDIPLSRLAPWSFVRRFAEFWKERRKEASYEGLLVVQITGKKWDTSHTSKEIESVFREQKVYDMKFHHLRDSFAAVVVLRWLVAFHSNLNLQPSDFPFLSYELFDEENLTKFKKMILGMGDQNKYQDLFSHIMAALAKLLGHGGPIVSLQSYVHVVDWLFYFFTKRNVPEHIQLSCKIAADLLQVTYPSLPDEMKGRGLKKIKAANFLQFQRDLIGLPKPNRPIPRKKTNRNTLS